MRILSAKSGIYICRRKRGKPLLSFKSNDSQQITLNDALFGPTDREKRMLEKSLAKPFAEKIFTKIDESLFACLYSDKTLSHFRKRCYTYELATGTALIYETIIGLSGEMAKIMKIN